MTDDDRRGSLLVARVTRQVGAMALQNFPEWDKTNEFVFFVFLFLMTVMSQ